MPHSTAELLQHLAAATKRPFLVGFDGRGGAGKSTLAKSWCEQMPDAVIVHVDDFYRVIEESVRESFSPQQGYERNFDWQRLEQQVLQPLTVQQPARYERYDWVQQALAETIEVNPHKIVLVEGVGSTRPELRNYYDLRIWVETSDAERMRRQYARRENTNEQITRWAAAEAYYVDNFRPAESAHFIVAGELAT